MSGEDSEVIGILTFYWADDYGGMLQAYALKRQLELLGEKAEFIPYAPVRLTGRYWLCPLWAERKDSGLHYFFHRYLFKQNLLLGRSYWRRRRMMRAFRYRYLTKRLPVRSVKYLSLQPYQTVFVGSDQVWNPDITIDLDDAYIGNIPRRGDCRLIAYGASLGGNPLLADERKKFARHVCGFSAVSVREETDVPRIERLLGRKVWNVLDPVLLLGRAEWEKVSKRYTCEGAIVVCTTQPDELLLDYVRSLSKDSGRKIISLSRPSNLSGHFRDGKAIPEIDVRIESGPAEFLGYIRSAYCVLTNSFHAMAFSILWEKPFLCFRHSTRSARQEDLLRKLGLLSHLVGPDKPGNVMEIWSGTDWKQVRRRLAEARELSRRYIIENM